MKYVLKTFNGKQQYEKAKNKSLINQALTNRQIEEDYGKDKALGYFGTICKTSYRYR